MTLDAENILLLHILSVHHNGPMLIPPIIDKTTIPPVNGFWSWPQQSAIQHPTNQHPTKSISNTSKPVNSTDRWPTHKLSPANLRSSVI